MAREERQAIPTMIKAGYLPYLSLMEVWKAIHMMMWDGLVTYNGEEIIYDEDGNMLYGPLDGEMVEYEYDCRNRLVRAGDTTYEYDAEDNRIAVETPEYREEYLVDSSQSLTRILEIERSYKGDDSEQEESAQRESEYETYYYGNGMLYEDSSVYGLLVYHFDHLGSTKTVTDADGEIVAEFSYGTYGELVEAEYKTEAIKSLDDTVESDSSESNDSLTGTTTEYGTVPTIRFLYNGQLGVSTDENGLYYMRSRYYNPYIKRFINQDILTGNISNSASLNRYSYVEGNPVSYTDPFGLSPFSYITDVFDFSAIIHTTFDVLGCLPGGGIFDIANMLLYAAEGNGPEAIKSLIFAIPGMDLVGKASKYAAKGGKFGNLMMAAAKLITGMGYLGSICLSARDFGYDIAYMIDKYMVGEAEFSKDTVYELLRLGGHGFQLSQFSKPFLTDLNTKELSAAFKNAFANFWKDNGGHVDPDAFRPGYKGGSNTSLSKYNGIIIDDSVTKKGNLKIDYLFENRSDAMNYARNMLGYDATRIYDDTGKWIGWSGSKGKVYWGHGDWGQGLGKSTFPHLNYDFGTQKGHLFLKDKIINRGEWDEFSDFFGLKF